MTQAYSSSKRENDPHALPDLEVFYRTELDNTADGWLDDDGHPFESGWYWWSCQVGCMPDSDPVGPFDTEALALEDARDGLNDEGGE